MADATSSDSARDRRWLILGVISLGLVIAPAINTGTSQDRHRSCHRAAIR